MDNGLIFPYRYRPCEAVMLSPKRDSSEVVEARPTVVGQAMG